MAAPAAAESSLLSRQRGLLHCVPELELPDAIHRGGLLAGAGELVGGTEEEGPVVRLAGAVETEHGELVAGGRGWLGGALQQVLDGGVEGFGDPGDVAAQLAGAVGFPLGDGTATDAAGGGEVILGEATGASESADAAADGGGFV